MEGQQREGKFANDEDIQLGKHELSLHGASTADQNQRAAEKKGKHSGKEEAADDYLDETVDKKHHRTNEQKKEEKKLEHEAHRSDRLHKASDFRSEPA